MWRLQTNGSTFETNSLAELFNFPAAADSEPDLSSFLGPFGHPDLDALTKGFFFTEITFSLLDKINPDRDSSFFICLLQTT